MDAQSAQQQEKATQLLERFERSAVVAKKLQTNMRTLMDMQRELAGELAEFCRAAGIPVEYVAKREEHSHDQQHHS